MGRRFIHMLVFILILLTAHVCSAKVIRDLESSFSSVSKIKNVSADPVSGGDALDKIQSGSLSAFHYFKTIVSGLILIYLIYAGFQLVMAMGAEDKLAAGKRQIYYSLVAFIFVNIPGEVYYLFAGKSNENVTSPMTDYKSVEISSGNGNIFVNFINWDGTVEGGIISFVKTIVIGLVILMFMMGGVGLISSGGNEEKRKKVKNRFINGVIGLIFLGLIHAWTEVVYNGKITSATGNSAQSIFSRIANLALFFAGPTAIFFLILGGFYYLTSAGDEGKAKKGGTIIKNTFVATLILLASYAFLMDLASFTM